MQSDSLILLFIFVADKSLPLFLLCLQDRLCCVYVGGPQGLALGMLRRLGSEPAFRGEGAPGLWGVRAGLPPRGARAADVARRARSAPRLASGAPPIPACTPLSPLHSPLWFSFAGVSRGGLGRRAPLFRCFLSPRKRCFVLGHTAFHSTCLCHLLRAVLSNRHLGALCHFFFCRCVLFTELKNSLESCCAKGADRECDPEFYRVIFLSRFFVRSDRACS